MPQISNRDAFVVWLHAVPINPPLSEGIGRYRKAKEIANVEFRLANGKIGRYRSVIDAKGRYRSVKKILAGDPRIFFGFPILSKGIMYLVFEIVMKRAVFLDRDGTIIVDKDYLHLPEEVVVYPGVGAALRGLKDAGFLLFLVTNQSGVGRGYFTIEDVEKVHEHLGELFGRQEVGFDRIYIAPEAPGKQSHGRKPSPQFLFDARDEFGVDLGNSFMVGDKVIDLECGWNAGVKKSLLVRTGYGTEVEKAGEQGAALVVDGFAEAAEWILKN